MNALYQAGVPAKHITVVGASKGAGITIYISHMLANNEVNYVLLAICNPDNLKAFNHDQVFLYGNVLSIYDSSDELAGSCQEYAVTMQFSDRIHASIDFCFKSWDEDCSRDG